MEYLEDKGLISIAGKDAKNFLQGLITIDIREINPTQYRLAGCCNNKGRVVASFNLFEYKNIYYFSLPKRNIPTTIKHLRKYAMFSKIDIQEATENFVLFGVIGVHALEKLQKNPPEKEYECHQMDGMTVLRLPGNQARFEVILERTYFERLGISKNLDKNVQWKQLNILSGLPVIDLETSGLFTPQMLNYDQFKGISFNKGCYLGQEIVARTANLGSTKRHLHAFILESNQSPSVGEMINNEQAIDVGVVLETCQNDALIYLSAVIQDTAIPEKIYWQESLLIKAEPSHSNSIFIPYKEKTL